VVANDSANLEINPAKVYEAYIVEFEVSDDGKTSEY
jgi:hypothetical protein